MFLHTFLAASPAKKDGVEWPTGQRPIAEGPGAGRTGARLPEETRRHPRAGFLTGGRGQAAGRCASPPLQVPELPASAAAGPLRSRWLRGQMHGMETVSAVPVTGQGTVGRRCLLSVPGSPQLWGGWACRQTVARPCSASPAQSRHLSPRCARCCSWSAEPPQGVSAQGCGAGGARGSGRSFHVSCEV